MDALCYKFPVVEQRGYALVVVDAGDDLGKKARYVGFYVPLFFEEMAVVNRVCTEYLEEIAFLVSLFEIVDCRCRKERKRHRSDDFGDAEFLEIFHGL